MGRTRRLGSALHKHLGTSFPQTPKIATSSHPLRTQAQVNCPRSHRKPIAKWKTQPSFAEASSNNFKPKVIFFVLSMPKIGAPLQLFVDINKIPWHTALKKICFYLSSLQIQSNIFPNFILAGRVLRKPSQLHISDSVFNTSDAVAFP